MRRNTKNLDVALKNHENEQIFCLGYLFNFGCVFFQISSYSLMFKVGLKECF